MRIKKILSLGAILLILLPSGYAIAAPQDNGSPIKLDGKFEDWNGMPSVEDTVGDAPASKDDLIKLSYFSDEEYLYLYLERKDAQGLEEWDSQVIIHNGVGHEQTHFIPWENEGVNDWEWKSTKATTVKVNVSYDYHPKNSFIVEVKFGERVVEATYSASKDGEKAEFRIPLKEIGLDGKDKEIIFSVKSPPEAYYPSIDWIGDKGPIIITQGPVFGPLTSFMVVGALGVVAFIVYRK